MAREVEIETISLKDLLILSLRMHLSIIEGSCQMILIAEYIDPH